jgi:hypothetical protein
MGLMLFSGDDGAKKLDSLSGGEAARLVEIDDLFCRTGYFEATAPDEIAARQRERADLTAEVSRLVAEWDGLEDEIGELSA